MSLEIKNLTNNLDNLRVGRVLECVIEGIDFQAFKISDNKFELMYEGESILVTKKLLIKLIQGEKFLSEIIKTK